jgi:hypothetical protein
MNTETTKKLRNKPGAWIAITTERNKMNTETTKQLQGKLIDACDAMLGLVNMSSDQLVKIVSLERELAETKAEAEKWEKLYDQDTEHLASLQMRDNYGPTETLNETAMRLSRELAEARQELSEWKTLQSWGGTPQIVDEFIKGQQTRIYAAQDAEKQRDTLVEALGVIATHNHADGQCDNGYSPQHIAAQAIAAVKGGSDE